MAAAGYHRAPVPQPVVGGQAPHHRLAVATTTALCREGTPLATPQGSLYDVWLDLRLVWIFYPKTTALSLPENLRKVARQLQQRRTAIYFGERPADTLRFPAGAVVIARHPPAQTFVLYARDGRTVWMLVDDPAGRVKLSVARP